MVQIHVAVVLRGRLQRKVERETDKRGEINRELNIWTTREETVPSIAALAPSAPMRSKAVSIRWVTRSAQPGARHKGSGSGIG